MCLHELEGFDQAQRLLHAAPHGKVVDAQVLHHPIWVNDEQTSAMEQEVRGGQSPSKDKHKELDAQFQPGSYRHQLGAELQHLVLLPK